MEYTVKDANNLYLRNQDGTNRVVNTFQYFICYSYVKIIGTLDMYVQTAVLLSTTDQLVVTWLENYSAINVHAILMRWDNSQDHANMYKCQRMFNLFAAMVLFVAKLWSGKMETTFGETAIFD